MSGFDAGSFLTGVGFVLLVIIVLDLVLAGGGMSMSMMGGIMGTPWGWAILILLMALLVAAVGGR
ncbi:MAG: hypothetical protein HYU87_01240 [Chloroflexi bacterium]|nr:hypothetical protein [Chloroflexota bacterium]